jgi:UDP-N-acetylglucosamine:LPS N-acetylglucosamine transferase
VPAEPADTCFRRRRSPGALKRLDIEVALATDRRAGALAGSFPAEEVIEIASATPSGGSPLRMAKAALFLGFGFLQASRTLRRRRPAAVVGFGGYPTVPPVMAAAMLRIPTVIHEQNGVMGRANRFLAGRVAAIATGFPEVKGIPATPARVVHTGNPVRPAVLAAAQDAVPGGAARRQAAASRLRRQPGRAGDERHRPGGDRAGCRRGAAAARRRASGARGGRAQGP